MMRMDWVKNKIPTLFNLFLFYFFAGAKREAIKSRASLQKEMGHCGIEERCDRYGWKVWISSHDNLMIPTNLSLTTQQMGPQAKDKVVYICVRIWEKSYYCMSQCKQFLIKYIYNFFAAIWPDFFTHVCFAHEEISIQVIWTEIQ
jgi:hypothetical protein